MESVPITRIIVEGDRRPAKALENLKQSIAEFGLLQPITVTPDYCLIAGNRRLEAHRELGRKEILCRVLDLDEIDRELAGIDENVTQCPLTTAQKAEALARRKELYEAKHPEARNGGDRRSERASRALVEGGKAPSFVRDTAEKTGLAPRTIEEYVQIGEAFEPEELDVLDGAGVTKRDLVELSRCPREVRSQTVERVESEGKAAVGELLAAAASEQHSDQREGKDKAAALPSPQEQVKLALAWEEADRQRRGEILHPNNNSNGKPLAMSIQLTHQIPVMAALFSEFYDPDERRELVLALLPCDPNERREWVLGMAPDEPEARVERIAAELPDDPENVEELESAIARALEKKHGRSATVKVSLAMTDEEARAYNRSRGYLSLEEIEAKQAAAVTARKARIAAKPK